MATHAQDPVTITIESDPVRQVDQDPVGEGRFEPVVLSAQFPPPASVALGTTVISFEVD